MKTLADVTRSCRSAASVWMAVRQASRGRDAYSVRLPALMLLSGLSDRTIETALEVLADAAWLRYQRHPHHEIRIEILEGSKSKNRAATEESAA